MKIGDRVRFTKKIFPLHKGMTGTIVTITENQGIGVEFDDLYIGNDCHGHAMKKKGYYVSPVNLEIINDSPARPDKNWKIVIVPDGDKTIAKFIQSGKCVKEVSVNKYYKDEYNPEIAVREVINKLYQHTGYTGKAVYTSTAALHDGFTYGKVYDFFEGKCYDDNNAIRNVFIDKGNSPDCDFAFLFIKIVE